MPIPNMESITANWANTLLSARISKVPSPDIQIRKRQKRTASRLWRQGQDVNLKKKSYNLSSRASSDKPIKIVSRATNSRRAASARPLSVWSVQSEASVIQSTSRHRFLNRLASGLFSIDDLYHGGETEGFENVDTTGTLRTDIAQLTIDVSQAKIDDSGLTFFAVDINCSIDTIG